MHAISALVLVPPWIKTRVDQRLTDELVGSSVAIGEADAQIPESRLDAFVRENHVTGRASARCGAKRQSPHAAAAIHALSGVASWAPYKSRVQVVIRRA